MPFRNYSPFFLPEELDALTAAFDAAWQHRRVKTACSLCRTGSHRQERSRADHYYVSASNGKLDAEELKEIALRTVFRAQPLGTHRRKLEAISRRDQAQVGQAHRRGSNSHQRAPQTLRRQRGVQKTLWLCRGSGPKGR